MTAQRRPAAASSVVEELSAVLAPADLARLLERLGGRNLFVPLKAGENHPITVAIGATAAAELTSFFAGRYLSLPLPRDKAARIVELAKTITNRWEIARKVGCTERHVYKVLRQQKAAALAPRAPDLFT